MRIKILTIMLALLQPIIIIYNYGCGFKSFSKVWGSEIEWIFILCNFLVIKSFLEHPRWRLSALFLLLLTCFSTNSYSNCHNLLAVIFFLSCLYSLTEFKSMRNYFYAYCFSVVIGLLSNLFWFEFYAVYVLCAYHLNLYWINYKYENRNKN